MLEQKIDELTKQIEKLILQLQDAPLTQQPQLDVAPKAEEPKAEKPELVAETIEPEVEAVEPEAETPEPEVETIEPEIEPEEPEDSDDWAEDVSDMPIDQFRKALLPLGPAKGPAFLKKHGYNKVTDVPPEERATIAEAAKALLGK